MLNTDIKYLQGVGPKKAEILFKELSIATYEDLLYHFPFRYIDRTKFYSIQELSPDLPHVQLRGKITGAKLEGKGARNKRLIFTFSDGTGRIELIFFQGIKWMQDKIVYGKEYIIFGKPNLFNNSINIVHPEIDEPENEKSDFNPTIQGVYSSTETLNNNYLGNKAMVRIIGNLIRTCYNNINESLPQYLLTKYNLLSLKDALLNIHFPQNPELLQKAYNRLKFEELFYIQLSILRIRNQRIDRSKGIAFSKVGEHFNYFYHNNLKFEMTNAQKRVVKEIRADMGSGKQMNRLLQGDVGSGKTLVALLGMLIAADNGYQSCIMAPTEILANQHYQSIQTFLEGMEIKVAILTGSTKKAERTRLLATLRSGKIDILIGTHALIEDTVQFSSLGLAVIDEQHRFGVEQRSKLWAKNETPPHVLVMTATPIPRTLAMTLYGDLEVSVIDELPPGRKPVKTVVYNDSKRLSLFGFIRDQIAEGRQVYVVFPLIKESEKMDYKDLEDGYESITRAFPPPQYVTSVVHGKMKAEDKDFSMQLFSSGKAHIMVATSVIEVGVNVPNATVMVIESAERFGLSQLHQLRGRVGRGGDQSYCILMAGYKLSADSKRRLALMAETNDGFRIAEEDLKLRGPGDIEGTQQSGLALNLRLTNLAKDGKLMEFVRKIVENILEHDPSLNMPENSVLIHELNRKKKKESANFSEIS